MLVFRQLFDPTSSTYLTPAHTLGTTVWPRYAYLFTG